MNYCYLCGKDRKNHETGCIEPLIAHEVIEGICKLIANDLGIVVCNTKAHDGMIGVLFRHAFDDDEDDTNKYYFVKGKRLHDVVFTLIKSLGADLKKRDVTLISYNEAKDTVEKILSEF